MPRRGKCCDWRRALPVGDSAAQESPTSYGMGSVRPRNMPQIFPARTRVVAMGAIKATLGKVAYVAVMTCVYAGSR